jgi:hypothetical protein
MQPARAPRAHEDTATRAHLRANVQAAAGGDRHPGDWRLHYYAVHDLPGDFTPVRPPDVIEAELSPFGELLEHLAGIFGPDDAQLIARRDMEAGS